MFDRISVRSRLGRRLGGQDGDPADGGVDAQQQRVEVQPPAGGVGVNDLGVDHALSGAVSVRFRFEAVGTIGQRGDRLGQYRHHRKVHAEYPAEWSAEQPFARALKSQSGVTAWPWPVSSTALEAGHGAPRRAPGYRRDPLLHPGAHHHVDPTAADMLEDLDEALNAKGISLVLAEKKDPVREWSSGTS
jgi:hypothetical protein